MKYFQVSFDVEKTGLKKGIHQIQFDKKNIQKDKAFNEFLNIFNSKPIDFLKNQVKIYSLKIPPIKAKLLKKANVTDIMAYTPNLGLFINNVYSEKYVKILQAFNIGNYVSFEVVIESVTEKYFLLYFETIPLSEINYQKSKVITGHKVTNNLKYYEINSINEYLEFRQVNVLGGFEKIAISKANYGKDIIKIQATSKSFYSEKLIDFLLDSEITGLKVDYKNSIQLEFY